MTIATTLRAIATDLTKIVGTPIIISIAKLVCSNSLFNKPTASYIFLISILCEYFKSEITIVLTFFTYAILEKYCLERKIVNAK